MRERSHQGPCEQSEPRAMFCKMKSRNGDGKAGSQTDRHTRFTVGQSWESSSFGTQNSPIVFNLRATPFNECRYRYTTPPPNLLRVSVPRTAPQPHRELHKRRVSHRAKRRSPVWCRRHLAVAVRPRAERPCPPAAHMPVLAALAHHPAPGHAACSRV
jgi:hypothetical protein